ncbi:Arc family DNA-binding protein, partial [Pseudomonas syringae pv. tagetis]|uniref:Arc family DNA-binding protein n=1 Tax=Pseudomonas syringae group genomosp. 7 TaxID=251699 RepID=UPI00376FFEA0
MQSAADANGRSMNAEIVATLEKAYPAPLSLELIKRLQGLIDDRIAEARAKIDRKELLADQELDDIERDLLANIELLNSLTSALDARIEAVKQ